MLHAQGKQPFTVSPGSTGLQQQEQAQQPQQVVSVLEPGREAPRVVHPAPAEGRTSARERKVRLIQTATSDAPSYALDPKPGPPDDAGFGGGAAGHHPLPLLYREIGGSKEGPAARKKGMDKGRGAGHHAEFYMPVEMRERMLRRSMEVLRANEEASGRWSGHVASHQRHATLDALRKCHEEEGYQLKKKRSCGLCEVKFSEVNLPVAVTIKAIYDLRHTWMVRRAQQLEAQRLAALRDASLQKRAGSPPTGGGGGGPDSGADLLAEGGGDDKAEGAAKQRVTLLTHNGALLQPTRSYDQKRVCAFCAQFFSFDEVYRPSFGAKLAKLQDESKARELIEDNKFWDPLMNSFVALDTTSKKARQRKAERTAKREAEDASLRSAAGSSASPGGGRRGGGGSSLAPSSSGSLMYVAVGSHRRSGAAAVHGHAGAAVLDPAAKSAAEQEKEAEEAAFRAEAGKSAFWHAAATDTLFTKGLNSFKKTNRDRNLAKPTVV